MFTEVISESLDKRKRWYALNASICSGQPSKFFQNSNFPSELCSVQFSELRLRNGGEVSPSMFGTYKKNLVYVGTTAGIFMGIYKMKNLEGKLECSVRDQIIDKINSVSLDVPALPVDYGAYSTDFEKATRELASKIADVHHKILEHEKSIVEMKELLTDESLDEDSFKPALSSTPKQINFSPDARLKKPLRETEADKSIRTPQRKRRMRYKVQKVLRTLDGVCEKYRESLKNILQYSFEFQSESGNGEVKDVITEIITRLVDENGGKKVMEELISDKILSDFLQSLRVPDWVLLYFKLEAKLPDDRWQTLLNLTRLGPGKGKNEGAKILLSNNKIRAIRKMIFDVVRQVIGMDKFDEPFVGYQVSLQSVLAWAIREMRLHSTYLLEKLTFSIKLDGRPFWGKDQLMIGIVPNMPCMSSQSSLSVFPLAIANCKETRENIELLISRINKEKDIVKKNGIIVDGKCYKISFSVTLDYKALCLVVKKKSDDEAEFELGQKGLDKEFCVFCTAIRGCACPETNPGETCLECFQKSKGNIGKWQGIRDDLTLILQEELSSVNLCALHCEMRNTEQLLRSLGLSSVQCDSLDNCNEILAIYGPENFKNNRISVQLKPKQATEVTRHNIRIASFSGPTERRFLQNYEQIVRNSLPIEKVIRYFNQSENAAKDYLLGKYKYANSRKKYFEELSTKKVISRDFGTNVVEVPLNEDVMAFVNSQKMLWNARAEEYGSRFKKYYDRNSSGNNAENQRSNKRKKPKLKMMQEDKSKELCEYVACLFIDFHIEAFKGWSEVAMIMRDKVYKDNEENQIDIFDLKCKEWGFLLREMHGPSLGTGDYGHLTIEHVPMLMRVFRSLKDFSNQGFEASHKAQRQVYARATNHDMSQTGSSIDQILVHTYTTRLLKLRYSFRHAKSAISTGDPFYYKGCGWQKRKKTDWTEEHKIWIITMDSLFNQMFSEDFLTYIYSSTGSRVDDKSMPSFEYDHMEWEKQYKSNIDMQNKDATDSPNDKTGIPSPKYQRLNGWPLTVTETKNSSKKTTTARVKKARVRPSSQSTLQSFKKKLEFSKSNLSSIQPLSKGQGCPFSMCWDPNASRLQLACTTIPRLQLSIQPPSLLFHEFEVTNVYSITSRPPETYTHDCIQYLKRSREVAVREGSENPTGVCIEGIGNFNLTELSKLSNIYKSLHVKQKLQNEVEWLKADSSIGDREAEAILDVLKNSRPHETLLHLKGMSVDVQSFSDLACERYIDNFLIEQCILKFAEDHGDGKTALIPTQAFTWENQGKKYLSKKLQEFFKDENFQDVEKILMPVNMNECHWGLAVIDLSQKSILFDDGLKMHPPVTLLKSLHAILDCLSSIYPTIPHFQNYFWLSITSMKKFGMPEQTSSGVGSASCGIAVILAAKDFIENVLTHNWSYKDMKKYRENLMVQILKWAGRI